MTRHHGFREFTMCKAVVLAGLIGAGLFASSWGGAEAAREASRDADRWGDQIEFIDWDCTEKPVFAPMI